MVFQRNDIDVPLPMLTGCHPIPQPKWGYDVAQQHLRRLQPLCDVIQQLLRGGLMGADLCQLPRLTTPATRDDNVGVSGAKLSRLFLLHRAVQCGEQCPDLRDPCYWG
jgi:hypothetical protein